MRELDESRALIQPGRGACKSKAGLSDASLPLRIESTSIRLVPLVWGESRAC